MKYLLSLLLLLALLTVKAQVPIKSINADELFSSRGEIYFALTKAAQSVQQLTRIVSIDQIKSDTVFAYASKKEFIRLQQSGDYHFILMPAPSSLIDVETSDSPREVLDWNYYPTYQVYEQIMQQFATDYPSICSLHTIAVLPSGRKLLAARISDNVDVDEDEPEFLYTSSIHGDETAGYILTLHLIDYLLSNYNVIPRITNLVNNVDIWINPLANPDGTYAGGNNTVNGAQRYNANFIDLNRNYADPEDGPHPDGEAYQPETVAFMNFAESRQFVMSANFHGGAEVINYPWDTWSKLAADNNWWVMVSREYADTCHRYAPAGYMTDLDNGVTNGYAWYTVSGGRQDYMNYFQQCREVTMEISNTKLLPSIQLINWWNYNYRSLLNYLEQVTYGVRGIVTDTITGEPIKAQVFISGFDKDSSMVFTQLPIGNYSRLLKAGTYNITYFAEGYLPKTRHNVVVADKAMIRQDVQLWDGSALPSFTASDTSTFAGGSIQFTDNSGGNPTSRLWTFEGGDIQTSTSQNPVVTYNLPGTYSVQLYVSNAIGGHTLLREDYITVRPEYRIGTLNPTVCYARFTDSQGLDANYLDNENLTTTFTSGDPQKVLRIHFNALNIESSSGCSNDVLKVYDGLDSNASLLASICGSALPDDILTTTAGGSVTFVFTSDNLNNFSGWDATVSCDTGVGIIPIAENLVKVYPVPAGNGKLIIESPEFAIETIELCNFAGKCVAHSELSGNRYEMEVSGFASGIYVLSIRTGNKVIRRKVQILN